MAMTGSYMEILGKRHMREHAHNKSPQLKTKPHLHEQVTICGIHVKTVACVSEHNLKDHVLLRCSWKVKKLCFKKIMSPNPSVIHSLLVHIVLDTSTIFI